MNKWMITKSMFMTSTSIVEKGYISEKEAHDEASIMNRECDAYTSYDVVMYQDDGVINIVDGKIELK